MPTSFEKDVTVSFEDVSKRYRLGAGQDSLRGLVGSLVSRFKGREQQADSGQGHFWALKDLSFVVRSGETLGLVGPNGAGKTTTLKLLSKVTRPTSGNITLTGHFSSLIELGAGFHPDLTGRENVFLNGVILGLTQRQVQERYNDIVAFAELERFMDMPVKRYSSGMYARLGFAVAAHVDPDVMIVDEVLAVGDASFQQKCYDFLHAYVKSGKTTIFVSHNLYVIEQLCDRVIWLEHGQMVKQGTPAEVLPAYLDSQEQHILATDHKIESSAESLEILGVNFADVEGNEKDTFQAGEDIVVQVKYRAECPVESPHFVISTADAQGGPPLFLASMLVDGQAPAKIVGEGVLKCKFKSVPLRPRAYQVWGEVWGNDRARLLVNWQRLGAFRVVDGVNGQIGVLGKGAIRHLRADAPISVPYEWEY